MACNVTQMVFFLETPKRLTHRGCLVGGQHPPHHIMARHTSIDACLVCTLIEAATVAITGLPVQNLATCVAAVSCVTECGDATTRVVGFGYEPNSPI